jgi:hypothetical protein
MRPVLVLVLCLLLAPAFVLAQDQSQGQVEGEQGVDIPAATPPRAVIELYTSQGCPDCPEADALLKQYADKKDIVALTLPVDYWDYLGWKDTLANPRNADRQREYAKRLDIGTVYTPQAVVNGASEVLGSSQSEIERAIAATNTAISNNHIPIRFWYYGNTIIIEVAGALPGSEPKEATIWLAVVQRRIEVPVKGGENAGKTLIYYNVVRELTPVGLWNGRPTTIRLARGAVMRPESEDLIVLIQEQNTGPIIGAARLGG